jgi:Uma2 family endonuclease
MLSDMSTALKSPQVSVEDYLAGELDSEVKHEYLGGYVYAMAGARIIHDRIAGNVFATLHSKLRGRPCKPYTSDMKIRVKLPTHVRFYYPDVSVVCNSNPPEDTFQDQPVVVVEILSRKTRRNDQGEKKDAYLTIPSLGAYLLIEQEFASVTVFRRTGTEQGFISEAFNDMSEVISIPEVGAELPLAAVYDGIEFVPEPDQEST